MAEGVDRVDCVVIGAGVIGLACAAALADAGREVLVLEAASRIGSGTSSRNSEVVHAGIHYPPGSLKARACRRGRDLLVEFCAAHGVGYRRTGKLIIAARAAQVPALDAIVAAAAANDVGDLRRMTGPEVAAMEPAVAAVAGLFSPSTGIVDAHGLMQVLEARIAAAGGMVVLDAPAVGGRVEAGFVDLHVGGAHALTLRARTVVNAAGLAAPAVSRAIMGVDAARVPAHRYAIGHYYTLVGPSPCRHLVYPVPEDGGLGIHLTLDMGGAARFGPDVRWIERVDYAFDDSRRAEFTAAIRAYLPALDGDRLVPGYTGIRPKLAGPGEAVADFRIDGPAETGAAGLVALYGIESPGLTAALAIAERVVAIVGGGGQDGG